MKHYDQSYFHRWYRNPRTRVITPGDTKRKAQLAVGAAEYMLGRPIRTVLDSGQGRGRGCRRYGHCALRRGTRA
jgi:hypothetical protein